MDRHGPKYRTMDLIRAVSFGWGNHKGLNQSEVQVLTFIALRGKTAEQGAAFAWFPKYGQEWWAAVLMMKHSTIRKVLSSLRKKGFLIDLIGSTDERFSNVKGYGIPEAVMQECQKWYSDRQDMVYTKVPNNVENITDNVPTGNMDVPIENTDVPTGNIDNALTCGFTLHTPYITREETHLLTDRSRPSVAPRKDNMKYEDEWSAAKDDDDFAVPKEMKEKPAKTYSPNTRITIHFNNKWMESRETRLNLSVPWSVQKVFQARIKSLLTQHSEQEILEMIDVFFRLIDSGQVALKSDELWKDFWYNKGRLYKIVSQTTERPIDVDDDAELRRFRERMNR